MLKQEEFGLYEGYFYASSFRTLLWELRKVVTSSKRKTALASSKAKCSSMVVDKTQPYNKPLLQPAGKRKDAEFSTSDGLSAPAARRPTRDALLLDDRAAGNIRQLFPMEGGPTYAAAVVGRADPRHEIGQPKPTATGRLQ
jgi:hypothetical protein